MKKKFYFALILVFLILSSTNVVFGWGSHSHSCLGFEVAQDDKMPPETQTRQYPNANNGTDICHFIVGDVEFAHSNIEFANTMVSIAQSVQLPLLRDLMLTLAYGWGSHIKEDDIAHKYMLVGFDEIEHGLVELAVDWWLWNEGTSEQQYYAKIANVLWSGWLIWKTSIAFGQRVILPSEANAAGAFFSKVILGEAIIMQAPNFYGRAKEYSDNTRKLLEGNAWQSYYDDSVANVQEWFLDFEAKQIQTSESQSRDFLSLYKTIGEAAINKGGAQLIETKDEYLTEVQIQIKDKYLCLKALKEVLTQKLKGAESSIQKEFAEVLYQILFQDQKPSTNWGFLKRDF